MTERYASLWLPPHFPDDLPASASQLESIERLFGQPLEGLTGDQARWLLDYRDYARAVVERVAPEACGDVARAGTVAGVVYISNRRAVAEEVVAFMRKRFAGGADPDGLNRAVSRLECFEDVSDIVFDELGE